MEEILQVIGGLIYESHIWFTLENKKMLHDFSESTKNKLFHLCNQDYKKMKTPFNFFFFFEFYKFNNFNTERKNKKKTKQNKTKQKNKKNK